MQPIGFGEWPLSDANRPTEEDSVAQIHRAVAGGVDFIDTADAYCLNHTEKHHGEKLVARALSCYGDREAASRVIVATKGGLERPGAFVSARGELQCAASECIESCSVLRVSAAVCCE